MKNIVKSMFIFLSIFIVMFICENASAISITSEPTGIYFTFMKDNGHRFSDEMVIYKVDGEYAYCIEPGISLGSSNYYLSDLNYLGSDLKKKIENYMYYGYKFDREGRDYYIATQALIWEALLSSRHVTFSTQLFEKGDIIDYSFYKNQITDGIRVMNNNFETNNIYDVFLGDELTINNLQLNGRYDVIVDGNPFNYSYRSQSIKVFNTNNVGTYEIQLKEKDKYNNPYLVYKNDSKQDLLVLGNIYHKDKKLIINIKGGSINLKKEDHDTHELLPDAVYGLYNENDELLYELVTDENGKSIINNSLAKGTYYIKELKSPIGYELDDNKYYITIDNKNSVIDITMDDNMIKGNFTIIKQDKESKENIPDTEFDIYDDSNSLIDTIKTDNEGKASIVLKYGRYHYQESKSNDKYELDDTIYDINIDESTDYIRVVYNNKIPTEDELIIPDVPNTNSYSVIPLLIALGVIIVKEEIYYYIYNN